MLISQGVKGPYPVATILVDDFGDQLYLTQFSYSQDEVEEIPDGAAVFHTVPARTIHAAFYFESN